jgi:3-oxo-5-alpha-steroid 4-dehydrogenase 1
MFSMTRSCTTSAETTLPQRMASHRYAIPKGGLYKWISYPNYLSEWIEWTGFAIAATAGQVNRWAYTAPWIFVVSEVVLMLPRAWKGHLWYHQKFRGEYPKERKAVIPFLL